MAKNLFDAAKADDKAAFEELLEQYEPLILSEAARVIERSPELGSEADDLRQEGRLALCDAARSFKEGGGVTFGLYAKICIKNRLRSYLRKYNARKRKEQKMLAGAKTVTDKKNVGDDLLLALERSEELRRVIDSELTEFERKALTEYLRKKSYADIAKELQKPVKSVDNAICRAKTKLRRALR